MNQDQRIGSIKGLQWALRNLTLRKPDRSKLYSQIDAELSALAQLKGEPKPESVRPKPEVIPPPPPESTPEQIAARESKRLELEAKIANARKPPDYSGEIIITPISNPFTLNGATATVVIPDIKAETIPYREPDYTTEPSDFRLLPHFRGRE